MVESASNDYKPACNDACDSASCPTPPLHDRISSLYKSAEQTIQVAEAKVQMYLAKVEQVELKHGIELMRKDAFIRCFTRSESINR